MITLNKLCLSSFNENTINTLNNLSEYESDLDIKKEINKTIKIIQQNIANKQD